MASSTHTVDHYEVLGVSSLATDDEIRQRYRFLALAFHPDRYRRNTDHHAQAELQIKRVNEAYRVLSDPHLRASFDTVRRTTGGIDVGNSRAAASVYAQSLQEMARASQRLSQVEQELARTRARLTQSDQATAELSARLAELEQLRTIETTTFEAERRALQLQIAALTQETSAQGRLQHEQLQRAERKVDRLQQDVERKSALIERLNLAKSEWEASSQSRIDLLGQRAERLRADLDERNRQLAEVLGSSRLLQEQVSQEQRNSRHTVQSYSNALSASETEAARLQIELDAFAVAQRRSRAAVRLWQIAAIIGIVNTVILLLMALQWLRGG